jgi:prophage antirepressor-like protein
VDIRSADVQNARGQMRKTKVVSEPGLYDLISGSEKPAAKQFRRWIFEQTANR